MPALKVYRTPIGFHDAYVAATSQKAALKAWGSDADLFARGVADVVTEDALTAEPLAHPGTVVKRLRGTAEEQVAAAAPVKQKVKAAPSAPKRRTTPRPKRDALDAAEAALGGAEAANREADRALAAEEKALAVRRRKLRADWIAERDTLQDKRDAAEARYAAALKKWQDG